MGDYFSTAEPSFGAVGLRIAGGLTQKIVNALYPMAELTQFHLKHHLPGLTGRWMDYRSADMFFNGNLHRLSHGHNLVSDGIKVLINKDLKFGDFLHHLGMDSLTSKGIPVLPEAIGKNLVAMGLSKKIAYEFCSLNLPKILGGSLGLVISGHDVILAFSDAIPHTFGAAGLRLLSGALSLGLGCYPPNPLLIVSGLAELGVSANTFYKAIVDPNLPVVGEPMSAFLPQLGSAIGLSVLLSATIGGVMGKDPDEVAKTAVAAGAATLSGTTLSSAVQSGSLLSLSNTFIGPFLGPLASVMTFLLVKSILDHLILTKGKDIVCYQEYCDALMPDYFDQPTLGFDQTGLQNYFSTPNVIPLLGTTAPIGELREDKLLLSGRMLSSAEESFAVT